MEFLAEASSIEFLTDLTNNYDSTTHSFSSPITKSSSSTTTTANPTSNSPSLSTSTSVKQISSKKLPAAHPPRVMGGGTHHLTTTGPHTREEICDTFSGIMDGITGEPLHGTRYYVLTGEVYEGPFAYGGKRHGEGAIVRNVYRPPPPSSSLYSESKTDKNDSNSNKKKKTTTKELPTTESNAKYYGSYSNDAPSHGTLVTSTHTYRGHFHYHLYHGEKGTLVRSDGYTYEGEFQNGLYHGMGREVEAASGGGGESESGKGGIYTGEFEFGMRHGVGTYAVPLRKEKEIDNSDLEDGMEYLDLEDTKNQEKNNGNETKAENDDKCLDTQYEEDQGKDDNSDKNIENEKNQKDDKDNNTKKDEETPSSTSSSKPKPQNDQQEYYTYSGMWYQNNRQGEGTEELPTGQRYTGQFLANKRHGYGTLYDTATNISSEGMWRAGIHVNGNGWSITYPNGDKYTGYAIDFIPAGYGICRYHNGDVYSGEWKNGCREGEGICVYGNDQEYIGEWKEDEPVGNSKEHVSKKERLVDVTRALLRGGGGGGLSEKDGDENKKDGEQDENVDPFRLHETQRMLLSQAMAKSLSNSLRELNEETDDEEIIIEEGLNDIVNNFDGDESVSTNTSNSVTSSASKRRERRISRRKSSGTKNKKSRRKRRSSNDGGGSHSASDGGIEEDEENNSENRDHGPPPPQLQTYPNKDTFLGHSDPETGHREGYGIYISSATGSTYTGNFRNNLRHGYGILIHAQYGKYAGEFVDDKKEGMGTLILNDASSYHGGFKGGVFDGKGTLCERDGTVYVGEWKGGFRHGDGMETLADGRVYLGDYKDGERHGVGTMLDKSGGRVIYSGSWAHGTFHGDGVSVQRVIEPADAAAGGPPPDADSNSNNRGKTIQYEGNFERGQRHGHGTLICEADGTSYKGKWHRDRPISGKWRIRYRDGSIFSGQARAATEECSFPLRKPSTLGLPPVSVEHSITVPQPHGFGTIKYTSGDVYIGNFERGKRQGKGTCVFANGDKWEGDWSNDNVDTKGNGVLSLMDGAVHNFYKS